MMGRTEMNETHQSNHHMTKTNHRSCIKSSVWELQTDMWHHLLNENRIILHFCLSVCLSWDLSTQWFRKNTFLFIGYNLRYQKFLSHCVTCKQYFYTHKHYYFPLCLSDMCLDMGKLPLTLQSVPANVNREDVIMRLPSQGTKNKTMTSCIVIGIFLVAEEVNIPSKRFNWNLMTPSACENILYVWICIIRRAASHCLRLWK